MPRLQNGLTGASRRLILSAEELRTKTKPAGYEAFAGYSRFIDGLSGFFDTRAPGRNSLTNRNRFPDVKPRAETQVQQHQRVLVIR